MLRSRGPYSLEFVTDAGQRYVCAAAMCDYADAEEEHRVLLQLESLADDALG